MPIGRENYEPHYAAGVKADATTRPDAWTTEQLLAVPHGERTRALQDEIDRRLREESRRRVWGLPKEGAV